MILFHPLDHQRGQTLIWFLIALPIFIALGCVVAQGALLFLRTDQLINHCNRRVLDLTEIQGEGLSSLAKINPVARKVLLQKRKVEHALAVAVLAHSPTVGLLAAKLQALKKGQQAIALSQQKIVSTTLTAVLKKEQPEKFSVTTPFITEAIEPSIVGICHGGEKCLNIHVAKNPLDRSEVGAPLSLDGDFQNQATQAHVTLLVKKIIPEWLRALVLRHGVALQNVTLTCKAQVQLKNLEDKWSVNLVKLAAAKRL